MTELETAIHCWAALVAVIFDNRLYRTIWMHQEREHRGRVVGIELTAPDLVRIAEAFGTRGFRVTADENFASVLHEALTAERPSVTHAPTDPERMSVAATLGTLRNGRRE